MKSGVDIVIVIFGWLLDLCECGVFNLDSVFYLVIDEVDKMFGMGMEE